MEILNHYIIDLQFFAKSDDEGRTEAPSERRRREKREEGEVAKSMELNTAFVFIIAFTTFILMFSTIREDVQSMMKYYLSNLENNFFGNGQEFVQFNVFLWKAIGMVLIMTSIAAIVINVAQVGFLIAPKTISPKFDRISFTFKKLREKVLFSKVVLMNLLFSLLKIGILLGVFFLIITINEKSLFRLSGLGLEMGFNRILVIIAELFVTGGIILVIIGIFEFVFKKQQFEDSLKVTHSEAKREMKQEEGNPQVKRQMKEMYNRLLQQQSIRRRIPDADVIITNPTHYAVALKYDMATMDAPMVIAKGEDDMALMIREIAKENQIEIIENPPLARELYGLLDVGSFIPEHLTMIIAEIFVELYQEGKWSMNVSDAEFSA